MPLKIRTKPSNKLYRQGWELVFGKCPKCKTQMTITQPCKLYPYGLKECPNCLWRDWLN